MNRTAIFAFYDTQGVADEYVLVLLRALRPFCGRIICVVNGELTDASASALSAICDLTLRRPNEGLDITAYKTGLRYVLEHPAGEDELLFLNATVFGPVYPFSELFGCMDAREDLDFWGMTRYTGHDEDLWGLTGLGYIPPHIQSYFWAVRKSMFATADFREYWETLPEIHSYKEAVSLHEMLFTKRFAELGYRWDTYVPETAYNRYYAYLLMADPVYLLKEQRCPVVKRKSFICDRTEQSMPVSGDSGRALYAFLRDETDYDVSLIAKNITRTENNFDYTLATAEVLTGKIEGGAPKYVAETAEVNDEDESNGVLCGGIEADAEEKFSFTAKSGTPEGEETGTGTEMEEDCDVDTVGTPKKAATTVNMGQAETLSISHPADKSDRRADTAQIIWITDPDCLEVLKSELLSGTGLFLYHTQAVNEEKLCSLFPGAAVIRRTGADVREVLKRARADIGDSAEYIAWLCAVPEIFDFNPGKPPRPERDFSSFVHALRFCMLAENGAAHMRRDKGVGAVVPFPLTHRRHISPEPDWEGKRKKLEAAVDGFRLPPLKKEPLCAGWNAFAAEKECFVRFVEMAARLDDDDLEPTDFGYLVPLAAQSLGRLVAFAGDETIMKSQLLTSYTQLRKVSGIAATHDLRREDQVTMAGKAAFSFFYDFFNPRSLKERLYFALMAFLPRKWFIRLFSRGRNETEFGYPFDVVRPGGPGECS